MPIAHQEPRTVARRGFLGGLGVLIAAPAIVPIRALMPLRGKKLGDNVSLREITEYNVGDAFVTLPDILYNYMHVREAVWLFRNSNEFLRNIDAQYTEQFARSHAKIGSTLRIRFPHGYAVRDRTPLARPDGPEVPYVPLRSLLRSL